MPSPACKEIPRMIICVYLFKRDGGTQTQKAALLKTHRHSGSKIYGFDMIDGKYRMIQEIRYFMRSKQQFRVIGVLGAALSRPTSASGRILGTDPCRWRQRHWGIRRKWLEKMFGYCRYNRPPNHHPMEIGGNYAIGK